jgi:uncharacterized protein GlcG (DUF336 family)
MPGFTDSGRVKWPRSPFEGGIPIMAGGKVIGAIGVSGANADQDAAAGIKAAGL